MLMHLRSLSALMERGGVSLPTQRTPLRGVVVSSYFTFVFGSKSWSVLRVLRLRLVAASPGCEPKTGNIAAAARTTQKRCET